MAIYGCDEEFELQNDNDDRLYCSNNEWIGKRPVCLPSKNFDRKLDYDFAFALKIARISIILVKCVIPNRKRFALSADVEIFHGNVIFKQLLFC